MSLEDEQGRANVRYDARQHRGCKHNADESESESDHSEAMGIDALHV